MQPATLSLNSIYTGDVAEVLRSFPDSSVDCCVTSSPYFGLRDYSVSGQIEMEGKLEDYISRLMEVFMEVYRVLKPAGTLWLNLGDSYNDSGKCNGGVLSNCL
jgi:DNA modification methylase